MNISQECEAYAGHLQAEHRELHQRLRALQAELNNVGEQRLDEPLLARMVEVGKRLRSELAHHFAEEDYGGCMEYAVSRVPSLSSAARELELEHPLLLAQLDKLIAKVRGARPQQMSVAEVKEQFDAFVVRLLAHEARENRIIERGFNMCLD